MHFFVFQDSGLDKKEWMGLSETDQKVQHDRELSEAESNLPKNRMNELSGTSGWKRFKTNA